MRPSLRDHPFGVEAFFERSLVVTFAVPKGHLGRHVPPCVTPDAFDDAWEFVAVAMVRTRALRPRGVPSWLGSDFFLIGYRVFVRYVNRTGRSMRGLYILRSETDRRRMAWLGNLFTHYRYAMTDVEERADGDRIGVTASGLHVAVERADSLSQSEVALPPGSPFPDWKAARRFAGPMPYTFSYDAARRAVVIVEGVRQNWMPAPLRLLDARSAFVDGLGIQGTVPASAFVVENVPYRWKRGVVERWEP